jgi:hypothetical protein
VVVCLRVSTWRKSCPGAKHYYGTVREVEGRYLGSIPRKDTRAAVVQAARKRWKGRARVQVDPVTLHW